MVACVTHNHLSQAVSLTGLANQERTDWISALAIPTQRLCTTQQHSPALIDRPIDCSAPSRLCLAIGASDSRASPQILLANRPKGPAQVRSRLSGQFFNWLIGTSPILTTSKLSSVGFLYPRDGAARSVIPTCARLAVDSENISTWRKQAVASPRLLP